MDKHPTVTAVQLDGLDALMGLAIRSPSPPSLSNVTAITVGAPGASDSLCAQSTPCAASPASLGCAQTLACATLAGAVAALVGNPALRALPVRGIAVLASHTSAPIAIPSWLAPGLLIAGMLNGGVAAPVVAFAAPSAGTTLVCVENTGVVLSNLVLDGGAATGCDTALAVKGLYNYANNVTFQNMRCSHAIVTATSSAATSAAGATNTFELNTVTFSNISAPVYVSVWSQPAVRLVDVVATHSTGGTAGFLAIWGGAAQVAVVRTTLAGFVATPGSVAPPSASGVAPAAQGAAIFIYNCPLTTLAGLSISNVSSASGGAGVNIAISNLARPLLSLSDVTVAGAASGGSGGAISVSIDAISAPAGVSVLLTRVNVSHSSAAGSGGALFVRAPGLAVLVASSAFADTQSTGGNGGAIAIAAAASFSLSASNLQAATAAGDGGALWTSSVPSVALTGTTISGGESRSGSGGGAFTTSFSNLALSGTTISSSRAGGGQGGGGLAAVCAAAVAATCSVQLSSSTLSGNAAATGNGGGLLATSASASLQLLLTAAVTAFSNNSAPAGDGGGVFYDTTPSVFLSGCTLSGNSAARGGGLYAKPNAGVFRPPAASVIEVALQGCVAAGNVASASGGGAFVSFAFLDVSQSAFVGNAAAATGGGALVQFSFLALGAGAVFANNTAATYNGGGLAVLAGLGYGFVTTWQPGAAAGGAGPSFSGNRAGQYGGAIFVSSTSAALSYLTLLNNSAGAAGGALFLDSVSPSAQHRQQR